MKFNLSKKAKMIGIILCALIVLKLTFFSNGSGASLQSMRSVRVEKGDLKITVNATGEVKPYNRVEIKPPIAGRIEEVLVNEGDEVKQGQVMARMSSTERAALLGAARSQGDEIYKQWQTSYKAAPLTAPLDGTVIVRGVEPGQTVTTADPVIVISDRLIVKATVDETDLAQIALGEKTEIRLDAYRNQVMHGKVDHISYESKLVNNVNVYDIDIVPENIPPAFRSGMTANITFLVSDREDILLLPSESIVEWPKYAKKPEGAEFAVYKKSLGKLVPVPVKTGESDGHMTEIVSGVKQGEEIQIVRRKQSQSSSFSTTNQKRPLQRNRS